MSQIRITKQRRTARVGRRRQQEAPLPLDPRDPDITRAKQLRPRRSGGPCPSNHELQAARSETSR